jgi:hypothetical protein
MRDRLGSRFVLEFLGWTNRRLNGIWFLKFGNLEGIFRYFGDIGGFRLFLIQALCGIDGVTFAEHIGLGHRNARTGDKIYLDVVTHIAADAVPLVAAILIVGGDTNGESQRSMEKCRVDDELA